MKKEKLLSLTKEQLADLVLKKDNKKDYGLVFEESLEDTELDLIKNEPILIPYNRKSQVVNIKDKEKKVKEIKDIMNDEKGKMNYIIEGDNLHGLKAIEKIYQNSIDLVVIDPPYNTGKEFQYNDKKVDKNDNYKHSKWLSFMKKRLKIAKELMTEDGVIFVHIDDNEQAQLKLLMDEIFGEENNLGILSVVNNLKGRSDDKYFATANEFLCVYAKNKSKAKINGFPMNDEYLSEYKFEDKISKYKKVLFRKTGKNSKRSDRPNMYYPIYYNEKNSHFSLQKQNENYIRILPLDSKNKEGCWRWGKETFLKKKDTELIAIKYQGSWSIYTKQRTIIDGEKRTIKPKTLWLDKRYDSDRGTLLMKKMFNKKNFSNPKPLEFIKDIIKVGSNKNANILDFFAGSGTTGHAVLELNKEDGGSRNFILITNNENTSLNEKYLVWDYLVENNVIKDYDKSKWTSKNNRYHYYKKYINENFPLGIEGSNIKIKDNYKDNIKLKEIIKTNKFKSFLKNLQLYVADRGICQNVTYPRMEKVINGYIDNKGNKVEGLGGNLKYLKTSFLDIN